MKDNQEALALSNSVGIKPLQWVPSPGGKWLRAKTAVGTFEVRANDRMVEEAKQRAFDQYAAKVITMIEFL